VLNSYQEAMERKDFVDEYKRIEKENPELKDEKVLDAMDKKYFTDIVLDCLRFQFPKYAAKRFMAIAFVLLLAQNYNVMCTWDCMDDGYGRQACQRLCTP